MKLLIDINYFYFIYYLIENNLKAFFAAFS